MLRTAFIGAGRRSQSAHYPNVNRLPEVEMAAACELDEELLHQVAVEYDFQYRYDDHRRMLEEVDPDIVYCVMHERWLLQPALDCLNAGKHTFIEKPPGMNMDEVQQIHDAAVANDVICAVGFQRRHAAVTQEALRQVARLGPVSTVVGTFNKRFLGEEAWSFTTTNWEDVCHAVDLVRFMAGGEPVEVTAYQDRFASDYRNCYTGLVRFDNGRPVSSTATAPRAGACCAASSTAPASAATSRCRTRSRSPRITRRARSTAGISTARPSPTRAVTTAC